MLSSTHSKLSNQGLGSFQRDSGKPFSNNIKSFHKFSCTGSTVF